MYVESEWRTREELVRARGNETTRGTGIESNRMESRLALKFRRGGFKGIFFPLAAAVPLSGWSSKRRIATLLIALRRGTVIDSSLPARNATGDRVYTHTIARQTRSHAQDSSLPSHLVEMKLGRGVEIPPAAFIKLEFNCSTSVLHYIRVCILRADANHRMHARVAPPLSHTSSFTH